MRPEEVAKHEVRVVLSREEVASIGSWALKAGDESLTSACGAIEASMNEATQGYVRDTARAGGSRADEILSDEALDKVAASRPGTSAVMSEYISQEQEWADAETDFREDAQRNSGMVRSQQVRSALKVSKRIQAKPRTFDDS